MIRSGWPGRVIERVLASSPKRLLRAVLLAPAGAWGGGVSALYVLTIMDVGKPLRRPVLDALFAPLFTISFCRSQQCRS